MKVYRKEKEYNWSGTAFVILIFALMQAGSVLSSDIMLRIAIGVTEIGFICFMAILMTFAEGNEVEKEIGYTK